MKYPIVIHKDSDSDFGVTVPDVPGCFSGGGNVEEALDMAKEAVECHIEGMLLDAEPVPMPSSLEGHQSNPDYSGGIWALVEVDLSSLSMKSKRINITMPELLISTVDAFAKKHGESRSGLLTQAVAEYMAQHSRR